MASKEPKSFRGWPALVLAVFFIAFIGLRLWQYHWPTAMIKLKGEPLSVLVAKTPKHWYKGLGGRKSLEPHDGMLFIFPEKRRAGIVMRDMEFPIDIIWLSGGTVVDVATNVPIEPEVPETDLRVYYPRTGANGVLELPAGSVEARGIIIGDKVEPAS